METCKNCQTNFEGNYCNQCGQRKNEGRIFFEGVKNDFFTYFIDLSSPLNKTLKGLLTNPGKLIKTYIKGKRKTYYQPVQFFVLAVAFYYFMRFISGYDPVATGYQISGTPIPSPDNMTLQEQASAFMSKHVNLLLFILIAISSGFFRLVFRKSGYNYMEYVVFGFYTVA